MRGRQARAAVRGLWIGIGCASLVALAVTLKSALDRSGSSSDAYAGPSLVVAVIGGVVSVTALLADALRDQTGTAVPADPAEDRVRAADALAGAVRAQWSEEARLRRLQDPEPLNTRWRTADRLLRDDPRNIHRGGPEPTPQDGRYTLSRVTRAFASVPSRRLVVLGAPGSGKSVLATCFTLDLLNEREPGTAVPVVFPLTTWDPETSGLRAWLAGRLAAEYRPLAAAAEGGTLAAALLDARLVLPVLDGFDELPPAVRGNALRALNAELDDDLPVLLTSRTSAWRDAVTTHDVLTGAEVVELLPLDLPEAAAYLERTARPVRLPDGTRGTVWTPVLSALRPQPRGLAAHALCETLSSPLMVALARTVYGDGAPRDPAELLDARRFGTTDRIEAHLLDAFVPAAFGAGGTVEGARRGAVAQRRLAWLARELERRGTGRFAWWGLYAGLPAVVRVGAVALLALTAMFAPALPLVVPAAGSTGSLFVVGGWPTLVANLLGDLLGLVVGLVWLLPRTASSGARRVPLRSRLLFLLVVCTGIGVGFGVTDTGFLGFRPRSGTEGLLPEFSGGVAIGVLLMMLFSAAGLPRRAEPLGFPWCGSHGGRLAARTGGAVLACAAGLPLFGSPLVRPADSAWSTIAALTCVTAGAIFFVAGQRPSARTTGAGSYGRQFFGRFLAGALRGFAVGLALGMCFVLALGAVCGAVGAARVASAPDLDGHRSSTWAHEVRPDGTRVVASLHAIPLLLVDSTSSDATAAYPGHLTPLGCHTATRTCDRFTAYVTFIGSDGTVRADIAGHDTAEAAGLFSELPLRSRAWLAYDAPAPMILGRLVSLVPVGVLMGVLGGLASGLYRALDIPSEPMRAAGPGATLRTDRLASLARATLVAVSAGGVCLLLSRLRGLPDSVDTATIQLWLPLGTAALALSAWAQFAVARCWLALTGKLPWRLMAFLDEAHRRGVLRQSGAHYEFRHLRLQQRLARVRDEVDH
ncbi:NACHT domain-containing protein [Streptomyces sp. NPDC001868]|uniref:NACHT domain-containing protein n=1 Tax=Streptomyces sp. NPDC001868 TaxID=3154401 RepID=UPI00333437CB